MVSVNFNGKSWTLNRRYKQFCQLHESLTQLYPNVKYPQSSSIFHQNLSGVDVRKSVTTSIIEDRRKALQVYLQELVLIPSIKESHQVKTFLAIDDNFPELRDAETEQTARRHLQNSISSSLVRLDDIIEEGI